MTEAYPFARVKHRNFKVVMADPPWKFLTRSPKGEGRSPKYHTMTLDWIKGLPVSHLCERNAVLLLWVTDPMFEVGFEVMRAWGFTFKTIGFHWTKLTQDGRPATGMGFWSRANPELCLLGTIGSPKRLDAGVPRLIETQERLLRTERREHSRKPDEAYARTERLVAGPYLDLFSREDRPGWTAWGHEAGKFNPPRQYPPRVRWLLDGRRLV